VNDIFDQPDGAATPLTDAEKRDLRPAYISNRAELNAAEQENIARGQEWAFARRRALLGEPFIRSLHRHMLGDVWRWAGHFRTSERNIGIDHWDIPVAIRNLIDDAKAWIEHQSYPADEIALRVHHRLTLVHPFANGNGRHARLMADLLIVQLGRERFTWGSGSLRDAGELRKRYISALHAADRHDLGLLISFARS
jgi:Fic-DOC domain mobile mystery protein B